MPTFWMYNEQLPPVLVDKFLCYPNCGRRWNLTTDIIVWDTSTNEIGRIYGLQGLSGWTNLLAVGSHIYVSDIGAAKTHMFYQEAHMIGYGFFRIDGLPSRIYGHGYFIANKIFWYLDTNRFVVFDLKETIIR